MPQDKAVVIECWGRAEVKVYVDGILVVKGLNPYRFIPVKEVHSATK